ncbi:glutathione S-transferase [Hoeflea sp. IMCC20628]|uniref:glutathione S-transferase family protein n=1 Tax=Hoeflea sp. IMCC20628 TaxID=1620421 RepID=UPI00063AAC45|nr:glutathione S-transferase family protein [Hoeflea sp. IMCC20628]AKI00291.1 glutathione S-transferase [Hoeflea sp. IMCC20628]
MTPAQTSAQVSLIGADYSVYSRIARIALNLKGVTFDFVPLDVFAADGPEKARLAGHPFGKIPILRHGKRVVFETLAIARYIDQAFEGPLLQPENPADRARMNQIVAIVDTQVYPVLVWGLHVPKSEGHNPEPGMIDKGGSILSVLDDLAGKPWLCGTQPSLADAYLAASMEYILDSAVGDLFPQHAPRLWNWWQHAQRSLHVS